MQAKYNVYSSFLRVRAQTHAKYNAYSSFLRVRAQTHAKSLNTMYITPMDYQWNE